MRDKRAPDLWALRKLRKEVGLVKEVLKRMTLREKIGQTAMPSLSACRNGVREEGGYVNYLKKYPFCGFYAARSGGTVNNKGETLYKSEELVDIALSTGKELDIPLLIAADAEFGGNQLFSEMTKLPSNMSVGSANSPELTYKRTYYWAKELRSVGINWLFGPVLDIFPHLLTPGVTRRLSDNTDVIVNLAPHFIRGLRDAGMMSTAKHFPGKKGGYRDAHFAIATEDGLSMEEWNEMYMPIWKVAADAGADSFMTEHPAFPSCDNEIVRGKIMRPSSASQKVINLLRENIGFDGVVVTDALSMKAIAVAFEHDEMYIECLKAGNDVILFTGNDYIDVIEKAVQDGKVSIERIEEAAERVLKAKKKLGLFEGKILGEPMTGDDKADFDKVNYEICCKGATLVANEDGRIPFNPDKIKKVTIVPISPSEKFHDEEIKNLQKAFAKYGTESVVVEKIESKTTVKEMSENSDLIVYACYVGWTEPHGFPAYSQVREMNILFNALSYGEEKSVVASFGGPSIYYLYFEGTSAFVNMYTASEESMQAFVDGLFGKYEFSETAPVKLIPGKE